MEVKFKYVHYFLLILSLIYLSCKKEHSCEGNCIDNKPPIANAGPDQKIILPTDSVFVDGSNSNDIDGKIIAYKWTKISGPSSSAIINIDSAKTLIRAMVMGVYNFELTVTDNGGLSAKDTLQIIVDDPKINQPPVANAGPDQTITFPADSVLLNGNLSFDPDGTIVAYQWTKISGPASFIISNASTATTIVKTLVAGTYQFELKVTDNGTLSSRDTVTVFINASGVSGNNGCNFSMEVVAHLPTAGTVWYEGSIGSKLLFTRGGNGIVDIYDTLTHNWQTVSGIYATSFYMSLQTAYKTAKVGNKIIFSAMVNSLDPAQGQAVNIYDAVSESWSTAHLTQARQFYAMAVAGNKVFYAAGNTDSKKMDVYDATTNSWSIADFPNARNGMVAESLNNKIYFAGGIIERRDSLVLSCDDNGNNCDSVPAIVSSDRVDILDISTNTWSVAHLSEGRWFMAHSVVGNKIVFAGGESPGHYSSRVDIYDPASNVWSSVDLGHPIGTEEVYGAYAAANKLLIPNVDNNKIDVYDASTNTWSIAQMPFAHQPDMNDRGKVVSVANKIVFFGQYNNPSLSSTSGEIDIYDAVSNTWCHTQLGFILGLEGIAAIGNKIYVAGGFTRQTYYHPLVPLDNVWILNY